MWKEGSSTHWLCHTSREPRLSPNRTHSLPQALLVKRSCHCKLYAPSPFSAAIATCQPHEIYRDMDCVSFIYTFFLYYPPLWPTQNNLPLSSLNRIRLSSFFVSVRIAPVKSSKRSNYKIINSSSCIFQFPPPETNFSLAIIWYSWNLWLILWFILRNFSTQWLEQVSSLLERVRLVKSKMQSLKHCSDSLL